MRKFTDTDIAIILSAVLCMASGFVVGWAAQGERYQDLLARERLENTPRVVTIHVAGSPDLRYELDDQKFNLDELKAFLDAHSTSADAE